MSMIHLSVKHGRTLEDAKGRLVNAVQEAQTRFGSLVRSVQWGPDGQSAKVNGRGFDVEIRVDAAEVHVDADIALLGKLFGPTLTTGLKQILEKTFPKALP